VNELGLISVVPTLVVFVLAVWSRRPIESLLVGALVGLLILHGSDVVSAFADTSLRVMTDENVAWVILVCGFMGGLIGLMIRTGAIGAFTALLSSRVRTAAGALYSAWVLGIFMFVDDYLNSLGVGAAMRQLSDRYKISREKLAYVVDSTAAPISVIIPFSTWGAFFAGLLVANGLAPPGQGLDVYISAIPYMLYPWFAVLLVPVVIAGFVPALGPMKTAERRASETGVTVPPEAAHIEQANRAIVPKESARPRPTLFIVPMLALVLFTLYFDKDFLKGIYVTLAGTLVVVLAFAVNSIEFLCSSALPAVFTHVLTLAELYASIYQSIWSEMAAAEDSAPEITSLRRGLQRHHLNILSNLVLRRTFWDALSAQSFNEFVATLSTLGAPEDARVLARYQLRQIQDDISATLSRYDDRMAVSTQAHLEDVRDRISRVLEAPLLGL